MPANWTADLLLLVGTAWFALGAFITGKMVFLKELGEVHNRRGTRIRFRPDPDIFGKGVAFKPERLFAMTRSKAPSGR